MRKFDFQGEKDLREEAEQTIQYPVPLKFEGKKQPINYLQPSGQQRQRPVLPTKGPEKAAKATVKKKYKPIEPTYNKPKAQKSGAISKRSSFFSNKENKLQEMEEDEEELNCCNEKSCSSDCECAKNLIPKKRVVVELYKKKRKRKDYTLFFDTSTLDIQRLRKINFVCSSSGSSCDCSYEKVYCHKEKVPQTRKIYKDETDGYRKDAPSRQENQVDPRAYVPGDIPDYEDQLEQEEIQIQEQQKKSPDEPPKPPATIFTKKPPKRKEEKTKPPPTKRYVERPPTEEWAKYETPDVVHPMPLKVPKKGPEKPKPTKPLYTKSKKRDLLQKEQQPLPKLQYTQQAVPAGKIEPSPAPSQSIKLKDPNSKEKKKSKAQQPSGTSSSECWVECECNSD